MQYLCRFRRGTKKQASEGETPVPELFFRAPRMQELPKPIYLQVMCEYAPHSCTKMQLPSMFHQCLFLLNLLCLLPLRNNLAVSILHSRTPSYCKGPGPPRLRLWCFANDRGTSHQATTSMVSTCRLPQWPWKTGTLQVLCYCNLTLILQILLYSTYNLRHSTTLGMYHCP